jgi:hypothetical protein
MPVRSQHLKNSGVRVSIWHPETTIRETATTDTSPDEDINFFYAQLQYKF